MQTVQFDRELVSRYDMQGPRYTSYPTAVQFSEQFGERDYREAARASNEYPIPDSLSIYVHLPFCTSPCFYCACNRVITRQKEKGTAYLQRLFREIEMQSELFDRDREVEQLHLGGGTPTFYDLDELEELCSLLRGHFNLRQDASREFSIEVDPRTIDEDGLDRLVQIGFNRLSMGVQDFDERVQHAVNRMQSQEATLRLIEKAKHCGFESVSIDLIYGLPNQTIAGFETTLDTVIAAQPNRVAAYSYAHLPRVFKAQRQLDASLLPTASEKLALMQLTVEKLTQSGYVYIGMDHFALPDDELAIAQQQGGLHRNFQGYSTRAQCDLIGLGVSAIGKIGDSYCQNARNLDEYYAEIDAGHIPVHRGLTLDDDDHIRREVIQQLMCHGVVNFDEIQDTTGKEFRAYFSRELEDLKALEKDQLVEIGESRITVTEKGRLLLRAIAMKFDRYLQETDNVSRFSRTI